MRDHAIDCPLHGQACTCGADDATDLEVVRLTMAFLAWVGRHSKRVLAVSESDGVFALMSLNEAGQRVNDAGEPVTATPVVIVAQPSVPQSGADG